MSDLLKVRVARKTAEAGDICSFDLVPLPGQSLPPFTPGAHIDVTTPSGLVRQYSLCGDSAQRDFYRIGVLREAAGRGGSRAMHEHLQEGDLLSISVPRNHFPLVSGAAPSFLIAGGIGITPLLAMALDLARTGRPFSLHYCTRSLARTAFMELLRSPALADRTWLHHDDAPAPQRFDMRRTLSQADPGSHLYVCGPAGFIQAVLESARALGWPEERLHREFFSAAPTQGGVDGPFEVVVASSGRVIAVPADTTVVAALASVGIHVATSCEQGVCGTCLTRVLDGVPEHRDLFLTPDEQAAGDQFTPCCSRSRSARLVLDL